MIDAGMGEPETLGEMMAAHARCAAGRVGFTFSTYVAREVRYFRSNSRPRRPRIEPKAV